MVAPAGEKGDVDWLECTLQRAQSKLKLEILLCPLFRPPERKVRAPQGAVVGNAHRPRNGLAVIGQVRRRTGKVQQRVDRLREGRGSKTENRGPQERMAFRYTARSSILGPRSSISPRQG